MDKGKYSFNLLWLLPLMVSLTCCGGGGNSGGGGGGGTSNSGGMPTDSVSGTVMFKGAPLAGATVTAFVTNTSL